MRTSILAAMLAALLAVACASAPPPANDGPAPAQSVPSQKRPLAGQVAKMLGPGAASAQLISDPRVDPHRPRLPDELNRPGNAIWALYKICVDDGGAVSNVEVIKSAHTADLDRRWMDVIRTWRYRPYTIREQPVPFCYVLSLHVAAA